VYLFLFICFRSGPLGQSLFPLISRGSLVLGGTQGPRCFSRFKRSFRSFLSHKPCTAQADSAFPLLIPIHAERLRLKAFPLPQGPLCAGLLTDLGKTGGR